MLKFLLISVLSTLLASSAFAVNLYNCTDAVIRGSIRSGKQELEFAKGCIKKDRPVKEWDACYKVHINKAKHYLAETENYFTSSYSDQNIGNNACFVKLKREIKFLEMYVMALKDSRLKTPIQQAIEKRKPVIIHVPQ